MMREALLTERCKLKRAGRALEELVEALYRAETANTGQLVIDRIVSPGYLTDKDTGGRREFDVLVDGKIGRVPFQLAMECKDRTKAVDVPVVEGFRAKCEGVNVHLKMIVSKSGFTKPALQKAAAHGIQCRTLDQIDGVDWLAASKFKVISYVALNFDTFCAVEKDIPEHERAGVFDAEGREVTSNYLGRIADGAFDQLKHEYREAGEYHRPVVMAAPGWHINKTNGEQVPIQHVRITLHFRVDLKTLPIAVYLEQSHGHEDTHTHAVVNFPALAGLPAGRFIMSEEKDGTMTLAFVPAEALPDAVAG